MASACSVENQEAREICDQPIVLKARAVNQTHSELLADQDRLASSIGFLNQQYAKLADSIQQHEGFVNGDCGAIESQLVQDIHAAMERAQPHMFLIAQMCLESIDIEIAALDIAAPDYAEQLSELLEEKKLLEPSLPLFNTTNNISKKRSEQHE